MSTTDFGPVATVHYNPAFNETAVHNGVSTVQISGAVPIAAAKTLKALCNNPAETRTVRGRTGTLMWIDSPYAALSDNVGYYIVDSFDYEPYRFDSGAVGANFSMTAAFVGALA